MRGDDNQQSGIFSYISPEKRVPVDHPLRPIRKIVDEILKEMSPKFQKLYSDVGRPSIAPERLLRSLLLQIFYSVRSERMLMEQLQYNLLFRWFVGMEMDETVWNHAGSRCPAVQEVQRQRGEAGLPGTCIDGEPQRAFGADFSDRGQWKSGTRCCDAHGGGPPQRKTGDVGRGQELRHAGVGPRASWDEYHSARGAEQHEPQERCGSEDHTACTL